MTPRRPNTAGRCRAAAPLLMLTSLVSVPLMATAGNDVTSAPCSSGVLAPSVAGSDAAPCVVPPVGIRVASAKAFGFPPTAAVVGSTGQAGEHAVSAGFAAKALHEGDIAIGSGAEVKVKGGIAIGRDAVAESASTVSFGTATEKRRLVRVAAGAVSKSSDEAVTGAQLFSTDTEVRELRTRMGVADEGIRINAKSVKALAETAGLVTYDSALDQVLIGAGKEEAVIMLGGGSDPRTLGGIKNGYVFRNSKQAVNGGQLYDMQTMVDWNTDKVKDNQTAITGAQKDIATINASLGASGLGLVKLDEAKGLVTVAADSNVAKVSIAGTGGARALTGVKAGTVNKDSTEAVNGAQLFRAQEATEINGGKIRTAEQAIADINKSLGDTGIGLVTHDAATGEVAVAAAHKGSTVSLVGADGARVLTGVKDGSVAVDSTQAVNGRQLFAVSEVARSNMSRIEGTEQDIVDINATLSSGNIGLVSFDPTSGTVQMAADKAGGQVSIAGTDGARRLGGLANGVANDDAASMAQLRAAGANDPGTGDLLMTVKYDDVALGRATFGGQGGTVLANVAAGMVGAGSREAVNGGQLWDLKQDVQRQVEHLDGRVGGLEDAMAGGQKPGPGEGGTGELIVGADTAITIGAGAAAVDKTGIVIGHDGTATGTGSVAIGHGATADRDASVSVGAAGGERQIIHVADATAATDAVNLRQLDDRFHSAQAYTDAKVQALDERLDRMGAMSAAYAGMALNTAGLAGDNRVGVGMGVQNGKSALSVGYQRILGARRNISVSLGGAFSGNERGISAGSGISW